MNLWKNMENKIKKLFYLLITVLVFSCNNYSKYSKFKPPEYERISDHIVRNTAKKLKQTKDLRLIGTGGGMMYNVRMVAMSFSFNHKINVNEGRDLVIACLNECLEAYNLNEEIRPYLANYPFEPKNIEIRIFIQNPDRSEVPLGEISYISAIDGVLQYKPEEGPNIYQETYEEAMLKFKRN